jgi:hypothetical protein
MKKSDKEEAKVRAEMIMSLKEGYKPKVKQTAVEWLVNQLKDMEYDLRLIPNTIQQAKEMESQHMNNIHNNARDDIFDWLKKMDYDFLVEEILKSE